MIKAIFWDNDGILVDTEHLYHQASRETLLPLGIHLGEEAFIDISLKKGQSVLDLARNLVHSPSEMDELRRQRNHRYEELLQTTPLVISGIEQTLSRLHGSRLMAIVTSCRRNHFDIIHSSTGLLRFFDFVLTREDYEHSKPDPEPYLMAYHRSGYKKSECLVVEDSERGIASAVAAGLPCVAIPTGLTRCGDFSKASAIFSTNAEIIDFLGTF